MHTFLSDDRRTYVHDSTYRGLSCVQDVDDNGKVQSQGEEQEHYVTQQRKSLHKVIQIIL